MTSASAGPYSVPTVTTNEGILALEGYGLALCVERGHLVASGGIGAQRKIQRFSRVDRGLKRVVVVGHAGIISLDAIRWLHGAGVPLVHIDTDGTLLLVATPAGAGAPAQRRAQVAVLGTPLGVDLCRGLIGAKIEGQVRTLTAIAGASEAQAYVAQCGVQARRARTLDELRQIEPRAARAYWRAWQRVPVRFDSRDASRRPRHWRQFGTRISPLSDPSPRKAVNPANAILNYLYAILEAEARIATLAVGLDPLLGLMHTDRPNRDSLACDLMEPVRPVVDRYVLDLLRTRTFTIDDVFELLTGQCRLLPSLTKELAETAGTWARLVQPVAQEVADRIGGRRRNAQFATWGPLPRGRRRPRGGTGVTRGFQEVAGQGRPVSAMSKRMRALRAANRAWELRHGRPDPEEFGIRVLPGLQGVKLHQLSAATGLSRAMCTKIRGGKVVPHPRYWAALEGLGTRQEAGRAPHHGKGSN